MTFNLGETDVPGILREFAGGSRVLLLVRHAERPHIDNEDRTFGGALPLTPAGERMSRDFGAMLREAADSGVQFRASPLLRTVLTARFVAEGMGLPSAEIPPDEKIGNSCAFVEDPLKIWELFRDHGFFRKMGVYLETGEQYGFVPLAEAADRFEEYVLSLFTGRFGIFTTHDVYIAAYAKGRGMLPKVEVENWPRFMDSAAIVLRPDGTKGYAFVRAGLTDGICGV